MEAILDDALAGRFYPTPEATDAMLDHRVGSDDHVLAFYGESKILDICDN
jgi:hypothetical protein